MLIERSLKVAVPLTAVTGVVPLSVPLLGLARMATPTEAVLVVRLPLASWICTLTAGEMVCPAVVVVGC